MPTEYEYQQIAEGQRTEYRKCDHCYSVVPLARFDGAVAGDWPSIPLQQPQVRNDLWLCETCAGSFSEWVRDSVEVRHMNKLHNDLLLRLGMIPAPPAPSPSLTIGEHDKGGLVPLADCPVGLLMFEGTLCLKIQYENEVYVVATGEQLWGGVDNLEGRERDELMVQPVRLMP